MPYQNLKYKLVRLAHNDIWFTSRMFDFSGEVLVEAIEKIFESRNTPITVNLTVFNHSFKRVLFTNQSFTVV